MTHSPRTTRIRTISVLAIVVGSFALASESFAVDHVVAWSIGTSQSPIAATVGDTITFSYAGGHNVEEFADQTAFVGCDFTGATFLQGAGPTVVSLTSAGDFYYGCSIGSHCAGGSMSLEVTVSPAAAVPGANPILVALALGLTGLLAAGAGRRVMNTRNF